jgi:group I intron endonuclease
MGYEVLSGVVYAIRHKSSGRCYVGSTISEKKRRSQHFSGLRKGRHCNVHLQRAFAKYGEDAFDWLVLEQTQELAKQELNWIVKLDAVRNGFNVAVEPYAPMRGRKHRVTTKKLMADNHRTGKNKGNKKLTEADVHQLFALARQGKTQVAIAKELDTDQTNVSMILNGKSWKHLGYNAISFRSNNKSGCVGVYKHKSGKWIAEIIRNSQYKRLGSFINYEDAVAARKQAEGGVSSDTK